MKVIVTTICMMLMSSGLTACAQNSKEDKTMKENAETNKVLVAYFSATGTTESVAKKISECTDGDLVRIRPEQAYTRADLDWNNPKSRSSVEMNDSAARPPIMPTGIDADKYDVVFIGYPIWWDLAPRVVDSFIRSLDLSGKRMIPFATSGGSGIEHSVNRLMETYPALRWEKGRLLNAADAAQIQRWVDEVAGKQ